MPRCASRAFALNGDRLLLRRQRTQACTVSQAGNGRRRGRRHKEPKPTRRRGSCVAAPEKGKQLVRVGQGGASGGMQGGPRRGRSPITGPALPPAAQAAQTTEKEKPPCPQGTEIHAQRTGSVSMPLERPPRRRPKQQKKKSLRARRAHNPPLNGQALLCFPQSVRRAYPP